MKTDLYTDNVVAVGVDPDPLIPLDTRVYDYMDWLDEVFPETANKINQAEELRHTREIELMYEVAKALYNMDAFFRSGNDVPVERATILSNHRYVQDMKDVLNRLQDFYSGKMGA